MSWLIAAELLDRERSLGFDKGQIIREGVNGLDMQALQSCVDVDEAQSADADASTGIKHLNQFMILLASPNCF